MQHVDGRAFAEVAQEASLSEEQHLACVEDVDGVDGAGEHGSAAVRAASAVAGRRDGAMDRGMTTR
jgi:hypothetical protein